MILDNDWIKKQSAIDALGEEPLVWHDGDDDYEMGSRIQWEYDLNAIKSIQPVKSEQAFSIYAKSVLAWLIDYQIKASELKGDYSPYEVLSWVANDWRKASGIIDRENDDI